MHSTVMALCTWVCDSFFPLQPPCSLRQQTCASLDRRKAQSGMNLARFNNSLPSGVRMVSTACSPKSTAFFAEMRNSYVVPISTIVNVSKCGKCTAYSKIYTIDYWVARYFNYSLQWAWPYWIKFIPKNPVVNLNLSESNLLSSVLLSSPCIP